MKKGKLLVFFSLAVMSVVVVASIDVPQIRAQDLKVYDVNISAQLNLNGTLFEISGSAVADRILEPCQTGSATGDINWTPNETVAFPCGIPCGILVFIATATLVLGCREGNVACDFGDGKIATRNYKFVFNDTEATVEATGRADINFNMTKLGYKDVIKINPLKLTLRSTTPGHGIEEGMVEFVKSDGTKIVANMTNNFEFTDPTLVLPSPKLVLIEYEFDIFTGEFKEVVTVLKPTIESSDAAGNKKDIFLVGDKVNASGCCYGKNKNYNLYIVEDRVWNDGMAISPSIVDTTVSTDADGNISPHPTLIWPSAEIGKYDIIVDVNGNGKYDNCTDALDDLDVNDAGFEVIPEFTTIAMPVVAILGLLFLFSRRRKKEE